MEYLDLTKHDLDEFPGKAVSCNGRVYEIGAYLGAGAERITHRLINAESRLALHVLKIWRMSDLGYKPSQVRANLAREPELRRIIPISIEIEIPGGAAELQVYAGSYEESESPTFELMTQADRFLEGGDYATAVEAYQRVLSINPNHTAALLNLAAALVETKDHAGAFGVASKAREIEPNYLPYHHAYILYAAQAVSPRIAVDGFASMKSCLPNVYDLDELGARLYLDCGQPEDALRCVETCLLQDEPCNLLKEEVSTALKAQSRALALMQEAEELMRCSRNRSRLAALVRGIKRPVSRDAMVKIRELLEKAHSLYDKDPFIRMNLAFALRSSGELTRATHLLLTASYLVPIAFQTSCLANAAYCEIEASRFDKALTLLDIAARHLSVLVKGTHQPSSADLPGIGLWADGSRLIEEPIPSAARLIASAVQACPRQGGVPDSVQRLAAWYEAASADFLGRRQ